MRLEDLVIGVVCNRDGLLEHFPYLFYVSPENLLAKVQIDYENVYKHWAQQGTQHECTLKYKH